MAEPPAQSDEELLDRFQRAAFGYFLEQFNPENGLVADTSRAGAPASIAVVGFALSCYPVGVERGWMTRADAAARTLVTLRFFWNSLQSEQPDATGYKGFYYHFLDMKTGKRVWQSEVSLIDTTLLLAGVLTASVYFSEDTPSENEIRERADAIYRRIDWQWARGGGTTVRQGWKPESGFLHYGWDGYDEAIILYVLGLASPTHPLPERQLHSVDRDLSVGKHLRLRVSLCRAALHSSFFPGMDRFCRHTRSLHAREKQRLFRKQPARHLCPARIRAAQSVRI